MKPIRIVADFETTTDIITTNFSSVAEILEAHTKHKITKLSRYFSSRVWGWGICNIDNPDYFYFGNNIDSFFEWCLEKLSPVTVYFHNLKFDGEFILYWLFKNGYTHSTASPRYLKDKEFCTLISDKGMFYGITIMHERGKDGHNVSINIIDSLKILPFSVSNIAKGFGLTEIKGDIDYGAKREIGYKLTAEEKEYIKNDVTIVAKALATLFAQGLTKSTQGSNALADYKKLVNKNYDRFFPQISYDSDLRPAYKGGYVNIKDEYKGVDLGEMIGLDVVSLYPHVMYNQPLPYGHGIFYEGKYQHDPIYPLFIQRISCQFELKPKHIPTIQIKRNLSFNPTEYLKSSNQAGNDLPVIMTLTSVDLKLFLEHYDVFNLEFISGWKFKKSHSIFKSYIDKWFAVKQEASISGNKPMRQLAKLMLNSLYGKTATAPHGKSKYPVWDGNYVSYTIGPSEPRKSVYLPAGTFITAWARDKTIRAAQSLYDRWVYSDTDSLYLTGTNLPDNISIGTNLGDWEFEKEIKRARFLRQKSYILEMKKPQEKEYYTLITCAGMPSKCHNYVDWDNFTVGNSVPGKLQATRVQGGVVLLPTTFSIKS